MKTFTIIQDPSEPFSPRLEVSEGADGRILLEVHGAADIEVSYAELLSAVQLCGGLRAPMRQGIA